MNYKVGNTYNSRPGGLQGDEEAILFVNGETYNGTINEILTFIESGLTIPTTLAELSDDSTHRVVTDTEKSTWNAKQSAGAYLTGVTVDSPLSGNGTSASHLTVDLSSKVTANPAITGASKTKVTYDAKGLVTNGTDATTADIADSTDKRYCTDAQKVVISNTSNTNSGNETAASIGAIVNGATNYPTPLDADKIGIWDVVNSTFKSVTWSNIKDTLKPYFDSLYATLSSPTFTGTVTSPKFSGGKVPRVQSVTSSATLSPNCDDYDYTDVTALTVDIATINAPTGTPVNKQVYTMDIYSATIKNISGWSTGTNGYVAGSIPLPTKTVAGKQMSLLFVYNSRISKFMLLSNSTEA